MTSIILLLILIIYLSTMTESTLKSAWEMYKTYCDDAKVLIPYSLMKFKEELKNYFLEYKERFNVDDNTRVRSYYKGFLTEKFGEKRPDDLSIQPITEKIPVVDI